MKVTTCEIPGVLFIEPKIFGDPRGYFLESFNEARYAQLGITDKFIQVNISYSGHGVLRGMHLQNPGSQGKLVQVLDGEAYDVVVDLRRASPTFGKWTGVLLSAEKRNQIWVPRGFAHGFVVTGEHALFSYMVDAPYCPENEQSLLWNDPEVGIEWPIDDVTLSEKDLKGLPLSEIRVFE